jgi:NAD(P)-dependent dehydrogenase (short-subunit alcohol dehydrogenase family)
MDQRFEGKVVLVTGAGRGIGRASATAFAREGARVVVADVATEAGEATAAAIRAAGGDATFVRTDVSQASQVESLVRHALGIHGRLDVAHNNAGIEGQRGSVADCTEDTWDRVLSVNLKGVWLCMRSEIQQMLRQGSGAIVNTASIAGLVGLTGRPAYVASKHGIVGLTRAAALEYGRSGIRVNAVCPGLIDTEMIDRTILGTSPSGDEGEPPRPARGFLSGVKEFVGEAFLERKQPAGRMGQPEEVAEAVLWLASDGASYVNGHALTVDGGFVVK